VVLAFFPKYYLSYRSDTVRSTLMIALSESSLASELLCTLSAVIAENVPLRPCSVSSKASTPPPRLGPICFSFPVPLRSVARGVPFRLEALPYVLAILSVPPSSKRPVCADARNIDSEGNVAERTL
jgi:hypothetical protein